jgi:hypothetical protein
MDETVLRAVRAAWKTTDDGRQTMVE